MSDLLPLFVNLQGRRVVLVGGGPVAAAKLAQLLAAGADVVVVAPEVHGDIERAGVAIARRGFTPADLEGAWLVVAAATPEVNRVVAAAADKLRMFVNAVDDPSNATAFMSGVVRRDGVTLAISTSGQAPGLTALLREGLEALLPTDLGAWVRKARSVRKGWRRDGVPMAVRRPLLLEALNGIYGGTPDDSRQASDGIELGRAAPASRGRRTRGSRPVAALPRGHVSLVGAGPGDPALLTRRAATRLRAADLVLYDALVDERILRLARRAQRFFVGKRAGRHALLQSEIHAVMIRAAQRGRRVVRLKGGDPFVFGRGGEEALALAGAGVPFEVVPGVTSAAAAPALAGIPLTHRGIASAFLVVTGHDEALFTRVIGELEPEGVTLVILMGLGRRATLATVLVNRGWALETPAAIVADASREQQRVWRGTLGELAREYVTVTDDAAAVIVVGAVAALSCAAAEVASPGLDRQRASKRRGAAGVVERG